MQQLVEKCDSKIQELQEKELFMRQLADKESSHIQKKEDIKLMAGEAGSCSRKAEHIELISKAANLYCHRIDERRIDERTPSECSAYLNEEGKNLWVVIRKLADNKKAMYLIELLAGNLDGISFGDLKKKTGMDSNDINHTLLTLKDVGLVVQDEESKKYSITVYCAAFLATFSRLNTALGWLNESSKSGKKMKYTETSTAIESVSEVANELNRSKN